MIISGLSLGHLVVILAICGVILSLSCAICVLPLRKTDDTQTHKYVGAYIHKHSGAEVVAARYVMRVGGCVLSDVSRASSEPFAAGASVYVCMYVHRYIDAWIHACIHGRSRSIAEPAPPDGWVALRCMHGSVLERSDVQTDQLTARYRLLPFPTIVEPTSRPGGSTERLISGQPGGCTCRWTDARRRVGRCVER